MQKEEDILVTTVDRDTVLKPLEKWIQYQLKDKGIPVLAITITNRDKTIYSNIYSHGDIQTPVPRPDLSLFKVGSVSKLMTAIALHQLVEAGKLSLTDPITKFIPDFKVENPDVDATLDGEDIEEDLYKKITVFHLLRHTSGLIREPIEGNYFNLEQSDLETLAKTMSRSKLVNIPGTVHKYSNAAIAMVGYIVQVVSGMSFEDYIEKNIYNVINMPNTTFKHINYNTRVDNEKEENTRVRQCVGHLWKYWDETKTDLNVYTEAPLTHFGMFPAGCCKTTIDDISQFIRVFLNDGQPLLKHESFWKFITPQPLDEPSNTIRSSIKFQASPLTHGIGCELSNFYGLLQIRHGGAVNGFSSDFRVLPELGLGIYAVSTLDCTNQIVYSMSEYLLMLMITAYDSLKLTNIDMPLLLKNKAVIENSVSPGSIITVPPVQDINCVTGVYRYNGAPVDIKPKLRDTLRFKIIPHYNGDLILRNSFISRLSEIPLNKITQSNDDSNDHVIPLVTNDRLLYLQQYNVEVAPNGSHQVNGGVFKRMDEESKRYPLIYQQYRPLPPVSLPPPAASPLYQSLFGHYEAKDQIVLVFEDDGQLMMCIEWLFIYVMYPKQTHGDRIEFQLATDSMYNDESVIIYFDGDVQSGKVQPIRLELSRIPFYFHKIGPVPGQLQEGVFPPSQSKEILERSYSIPCPHPDSQRQNHGLVNLAKISSKIKVDLKYATIDNFATIQLYPSCAGAYLHRDAATQLSLANDWLINNWGVGIIVYDAYRPWNVTWAMSESVKEEYRGLYVADPKKGSVHNRGGAVDISLYDVRTGVVIEMPGEYDEFSPRSHRSYFGGSTRQRWYRKLLTIALMNHSFLPYPQEWWHFDYKENFPVLNISFDSLTTTNS